MEGIKWLGERIAARDIRVISLLLVSLVLHNRLGEFLGLPLSGFGIFLLLVLWYLVIMSPMARTYIRHRYIQYAGEILESAENQEQMHRLQLILFVSPVLFIIMGLQWLLVNAAVILFGLFYPFAAIRLQLFFTYTFGPAWMMMFHYPSALWLGVDPQLIRRYHEGGQQHVASLGFFKTSQTGLIHADERSRKLS